ncbi:UDP-N-acetylmuramate--L-alanine ligase [Candidatus Parcubacteria bacterium]|nr:UDP-N-acetylmuramate--L-alanine ligase [Patescibacteria group bacterium]MBU4309058.1 UDP-N-acetylmuramate--L-alanine ligase [Patescibacteria group bacterium]MBU4432435.1 UDP-N-acetylmuramate--L-alanine ligase [Patescibacteria group bacterium]MBU4577419.1 UDP-N-acetylmuramate--L-alanine ligase [Patescibacteria group bacterium]MCG2697107.1 UDP-N-acetylmuramate--L-alanine ligase [Candidatus Parcubacteria bacterium]
MDLNKIKKIYMIGIKGVGMTMLAQYLNNISMEVSGSDIDEIFMTDEVLEKEGIKVFKGFDEKNIPIDTDLIIYSTAYNEKTNPELAVAMSSKHKVLKYAEALGLVFNQKHGIAVIGSHGKTTTSAWLGYVMDRAGKSPSVMVGARVPQFDGASLNGHSSYLIIEADEYQNKLQYFNPKIVLLNNIDYDHPDYFPTEESYVQVFVDFIQKISSKGFLVANFDDKFIRKIANVNCRGRVVSYAINESADYMAYDIKQEGDRQVFKVKIGVSSFDEDDEVGDTNLGEFSIQLSGQHSIYNALAVIATCAELEIDLVDIRTHLENFEGTARRMQTMGQFRGATIIDDYAHHPTEIKATLAGARQKYGDKKIKVVFHPHTYTRTKALLNDFATSFGDADELIVLDIYGSAREEQGGVHSKDLVNIITKQLDRQLACKPRTAHLRKAKHIPTLAECEAYLRGDIDRGDIVILMGAGDIFRIGENLVK